MLTPESIQILAANGEGYNAEFKVSVPSKVRELSEEVCAFANAAGGILLIGVDDHNQIKGIQLDNAKRSAIQNSLGEISPPLRCEISVVEVDGKTVGVIEVPSGPNKPYVLSGAIYVRQGPNTQKLTTAEQMRDFFQQAEKIYFDETPCLGFDPATELDEVFWSEFLAAARLSNTVPQEQIFQNLRLYTQEQKIKHGAVLFFGRQPQLYVEKAIVRCVAFQGTN